MFERLTERARQVVVLSQEEARQLGHNYIGTEHLLLGLLREEEGLAARALEAMDVEINGARDLLVNRVGKGDQLKDGQIPFTPRSKRVLELALREALSLGHNYVGTEHILLAIAREDAGIASLILHEYGIDADRVRNEIIRLLSSPKKATEPTYVSRTPVRDNLASIKQQALENIEDALGELSPDEFLLFVGWLEGVAHQEQSVALAVRGERE